MTIELRNLKPQYMSESEVAGSDIYLQPSVMFEEGKSYMVRAMSGHGKSSLLNFIYGTSNRYDGEVLLHDGDRVVPASDTQTVRNGLLSYMFQDLCLFGELTAMENVQLKNSLTGYKSDDEMERMLAAVLPTEKLGSAVRTLSLGQRQRVAAVRALCQPFRFLLLDEPFSHLDRANAAAIATMMADEVRRQGAGLIVTALDPIDYFHFDRMLNL